MWAGADAPGSGMAGAEARGTCIADGNGAEAAAAGRSTLP
jgi:hypothetical protein